MNELDGQILLVMFDGLDVFDEYFGFVFDLFEINFFGVIFFDIKLADVSEK